MRLWLHVLAGNLGKMYIYIGEFWLNPFVSHFFFFFFNSWPFHIFVQEVIGIRLIKWR